MNKQDLRSIYERMLGLVCSGRLLPPGARLRACLAIQPIPLLDPDDRLLISWSAKSACTHVLIWHLNRLGMLEEASRHHKWVQRYRNDIHVKSAHQAAARRLFAAEGPERWSYLKVVRDPVARCVSSYRHALTYGYEDGKMSRVLGRAVDHQVGFSFRDFLMYLERIDLTRCNIHHRQQARPLDALQYGRVFFVDVNGQDLQGYLADLEAFLGGGGGGSGTMNAAIENAAVRHAADTEKEAVSDDAWLRPLSRDDTAQWPKRALLASVEAADWIRRIYRADYRMIEALTARRSDFTR